MWITLLLCFVLAFPTETHELNPFGNPNSFAQNNGSMDDYGGMTTTQFTGNEYDGGYQQSGGGAFPPKRYVWTMIIEKQIQLSWN